MQVEQASGGSDIGSLRGSCLVVKLGGEIMLNSRGLGSIAAQVACLVEQGVGVVVVHGGGPQADTLAAALGHSVRKVAGRRITDDNALEVAKMVYGGSLNVELLAALKQHGARGVGLSGVDADLISVRRRPALLVQDAVTHTEEWVDFGHVGDVASVDVTLLELLLAHGYVPVVASLAADTDGHIYNVNADTIAQSLAIALQASKLVLMTNVPGILLDHSDPSSLMHACDPQRLAALVANGAISGGMLPKVQNCVRAVEAGIGEVLILDGTQDQPPLLKALTEGGVGTTVTKNGSK